MSAGKNPIEIFRSWYSAQPQEIQETVAFFTLVRMPRSSAKDFEMLSRPVSIFLSFLDETSAQSPMLLVGGVLHLRAIIDFAVIRRFASVEWEGKKELNAAIADDLEHEHGSNPFSDQLREKLKGFPERQEMWSESVNSWRALRNGNLSDEFLEAWEENNRRSA
ncbi:MAG: hypothetical protein SFY81_04685 [Verrucomicrobiota bacterium]|nr:hypothetical protein [Verrucomicrobiota bacterium]